MVQLGKELPFEVGAPGEEREAPLATEPEETSEGEIPGYVQPWVRCANCEHFDGVQACGKFNSEVDIDGSCPSFEEGASEPDEAEPEPDEDEGYE